MIIGKFTRFIKRYDLRFEPRHKAAARLKVVDAQNMPSVLKALHKAIRDNKATVAAANGDEIELIKAEHDEKKGLIVLLFHRASPHAADPMYRKKSKERVVTVRAATKEIDEEQSRSALFIISTAPTAPGRYKSALEEMPGISIVSVQSIIARALRDYPYDFKDKKGENQNSYTVIKSTGVKSETLSDALKKGSLNFVTLIRPGDAGIVDGDGIFEPVDQRMKIKIKDVAIDKDFFEKLDDFVKGARAQGWEQFDVDINLDDERRRTVTLERDEDAKDVLFVRAEEIAVKDELQFCATIINDELVTHMQQVMQKG